MKKELCACVRAAVTERKERTGEETDSLFYSVVFVPGSKVKLSLSRCSGKSAARRLDAQKQCPPRVPDPHLEKFSFKNSCQISEAHKSASQV